MSLIDLSNSFSLIVMLLIFVILIGGTAVAFWKMLTDPTDEPVPKNQTTNRSQPVAVTHVVAAGDP